jgi:hypothetical protein
MKVNFPSHLVNAILGIAICVFASTYAGAVRAQAPEQLLRGILNAARQGQSQTAPPTPAPPTGMVASTPTAQIAQDSILWPTKEEFLEAARAGKLASVSRATEGQKAKLTATIANILYNEYQVPPIARDCHRFATDVFDLISNITEGKMSTLSDKGPDFVARTGSNARYGEFVDMRVKELTSGRGDFCDQRVMGRNVPHPYKAALVNLMGEYSQVIREFVNTERDRRKVTYAQAQQAEVDRQQAARAEEQKRIDVDAARIRADEQRRAQKERARVGG